MSVPQVNLQPALRATAKQWRANLARVIESGRFILGDELRAFEQEFAQAMGARYAVGVSSGSAAIELSLRELALRGEIKPSGEVLTTALTAPFTAVAIRAAGYTPRFCDIDQETLQCAYKDLATRATRRTQAIVPVHLYGQPCEMAPIRRLGLPIVQDACQAHGAKITGTHVAYSFYPTKNLGALGDGGCITTNSRKVAENLRCLRDGGRSSPSEQISRITGINARLDELQCCFLRAFLPHLNSWNAHRAKLAAIYDLALRDCPGVRLTKRTAETVNHLYVIRADSRDRLRAHLAKQGIGTAIHYPVPLHKHPAFAQRVSLPNAEQAAREILSLPLWPYMKETQAKLVARRIREFYS